MSRVRWQDSGLWPSALAHVPAGYRVCPDVDLAAAHGRRILDSAGLGDSSVRHFTDFWNALLQAMLPTGLVLYNASRATPPPGHTSAIAARRFLRFCLGHHLLCRVPGKLQPSPPPPHRYRAYLVITPDQPTSLRLP